MKCAIAFLFATVSAVKLTQKDAPEAYNPDISFAGAFSDSAVSAGFV